MYNENLIEFCPFCGNDHFKQITIDRIDYTICEYNIICEKCFNIVNRWGYGIFENSHYDTPYYKSIERKKKLEKLI